MKYSLEVRARAVESVPIEEKHKKLIQSISNLPQPWGLAESNKDLDAPDPRGELIAHFDLGAHLGDDITGYVYYQFRRKFRDEASHDDVIDLEFDPKGIDYKLLARTVFPRIIEAFKGYVGRLCDEQCLYIDAENMRATGLDARNQVCRVSPVCFFDSELCRRAFNLRPEQVMKRVEGLVEHVTLLKEGVYIVINSEPLSWEASDVTSNDLLSILTDC